MGTVANAVTSAVGGLFMKSVPQGAATQVWAATSPSLAKVSGQYLADCNVAKSRRDADDVRRVRVQRGRVRDRVHHRGGLRGRKHLRRRPLRRPARQRGCVHRRGAVHLG